MLTIYNNATLDTALATPLNDTCRELIGRIASDAQASDLWDLTCIIVIEPDDAEGELESTLGFDPLTGPLRVHDEPFVPYWAWLERHADHFEMLITAGDEGFAYFVLIPDADRSGLSALCRAHSEKVEF